MEQLAELQRKDPTWRKVMDNIELFTQFTVRQGVLFHEDALCLPYDKEFMTKVLHDVHDAIGHIGISKSYDVMRKQWYRPGILNILTAYVNSCVTCKRAKKSRQRPSGRMHPQRNLTELAFDNIAIDIFSLPLPDGYDACLTIMDTFTKTVILQPTRSNASTEDVAEMLFTKVICKGFLPSMIISDRDSKYTSDLWVAVMKRLGTKIQLTTPYHQQADPAERTIQTVQSVLRCYNDVDWVK
jgi:transposase InsO family protein